MPQTVCWHDLTHRSERRKLVKYLGQQMLAGYADEPADRVSALAAARRALQEVFDDRDFKVSVGGVGVPSQAWLSLDKLGQAWSALRWQSIQGLASCRGVFFRPPVYKAGVAQGQPLPGHGGCIPCVSTYFGTLTGLHA
jgi:hypothetical protein